MTSIESSENPCRTQDIWLLYGAKNGLGLDYLQPLFEHGGTTTAAAEFFANERHSSLNTEYWTWVKNQAFEKTFKIGVLGNSCVVDRNSFWDEFVLGEVSELEYSANPHVASKVPGSLSELTAKAVRIRIMENLIGQTTVTAGEPTDGLAYKIYLDKEPDCANKPENMERAFENLEKGETIYVILANTEHEASRIAFEVRISGGTPAP